MVAKDRKKGTESSKVEVGEIDTSPPFQSVKDAVSLFGEGAFSGEKPAIRKPKLHSAERILAKETQLHLAQKELSKIKEQIQNVETTKAQALEELKKAKRTVDDLEDKLKTITKSKESAIKATEAAKNQVKELQEANCGEADGTDDAQKLNQEEAARERYLNLVAELNAAKQELRKICQDCDASSKAKVAAVKQAAEAEDAARANMERAGELSKDISTIQDSIGQVKLASLQAQQEQANIFDEKDALRQSYKASLEESSKKLHALRKEIDPELIQNLEAELAETVKEVGTLQKEMENAKATDVDSMRVVTSELDNAKESLQKVAEEESSIRSLMESLKAELENVKKEHSELREKEAETETIAGTLHIQLQKSKAELELSLTEESKVRNAADEMVSTLDQLSSETEKFQREAEEMRINAEELKKEAEATRIALEEAEQKLKVALAEAEEAKVAEAMALDQIKVLSKRTSAARASTSESGANITISKEEFESLSHKVGESDRLAEMKVAAAMAQVEAVKAGENEALKRLETTRKEIEDMKTATEEALKKAEMAEAAKRAVEGELRRWREREQKKAAEAASRILAESQMSSEPSPPHSMVQGHSKEATLNLEKAKTSVSKKVLMHNLSGMFHKKKSQIESGSPYFAGQKPV